MTKEEFCAYGKSKFVATYWKTGMAHILGVSLSTVSRYASGERPIPPIVEKFIAASMAAEEKRASEIEVTVRIPVEWAHCLCDSGFNIGAYREDWTIDDHSKAFSKATTIQDMKDEEVNLFMSGDTSVFDRTPLAISASTHNSFTDALLWMAYVRKRGCLAALYSDETGSDGHPPYIVAYVYKDAPLRTSSITDDTVIIPAMERIAIKTDIW